MSQVRQRRWRPGWLNRRTVAVGAVFTATIFAVVLGVASAFARPPTATGSAPSGSSAPIAPSPSERQHDDESQHGEPND